MTIPTEPIGSISRLLALIEAIATREGTDPVLEPLYQEAIRDTIVQFEATGSPVITDGEHMKYCPSSARSNPNAERRGLPVNGLTALARPEVRLQALIAGFQRDVSKPVELAE